MAYIARYSPRPDTAAAKLKNNVLQVEKKNREKILNNILKNTALEKNEKLINPSNGSSKNIQILIESKKNNYYFGKTRNFKNVKIRTVGNQQPTYNNLIGKFIDIKIIKANIWNLEGELA